MDKKFRANAVDIWKRPIDLRYVYYVKTSEGIYVGTTWNSLNQTLSERGTVEVLKVADVVDNIIMTIEDIEDFKHQWRENYYNKDWKYSCNLSEDTI